MGTYTTNYQLYMPTVGEQSWGELVNGNFSTIDVTMKGLDGRITTLETGEFETVNCTGTITGGEFVGNMGNFEKLNVPITTNTTSIKMGEIGINNTYKPNIYYTAGVTADLIEEFVFNPITTGVPEFLNFNLPDDMSFTLTLFTQTSGLHAYATYYIEINGVSTLLYGDIGSGQTYNFNAHAGDRIRYYMAYNGSDTGRYVYTITLKCTIGIYLK